MAQLRRLTGLLQLADSQREGILRRIRVQLNDAPDFALSPPQFAARLYERFARELGIPDPCREIRYHQNQRILERMDRFRQRIHDDSDPLRRAFVLSLFGNIIDLGAQRAYDENIVPGAERELDLYRDDYPRVERALAGCRRLLIIGDNAGEGVLDRLLIETIRERFPEIRVFYAVRSAPAINDMILEDALQIGLHEIACVLESGSDFAGTIPALAAEAFRRIYHAADLIISKGQGNFETLEEEKENILFIFKVKCDVVAEYSGLPRESNILAFADTLRSRGPA